MKSACAGSEFTQLVCLEHREPDIALFIKGQEECLSKTGGELVRGHPARGDRVKFLDLAWRCAGGAVRLGIASRDCYPDIPVAVESSTPRVYATWSVPILRVNLSGLLSESQLHGTKESGSNK